MKERLYDVIKWGLVILIAGFIFYIRMPLGSNLYILHSNWHKKKIKISCSM